MLRASVREPDRLAVGDVLRDQRTQQLPARADRDGGRRVLDMFDSAAEGGIWNFGLTLATVPLAVNMASARRRLQAVPLRRLPGFESPGVK